MTTRIYKYTTVLLLMVCCGFWAAVAQTTAPEFKWAKSMGSTSGSDIAIDKSGNVLTTGTFNTLANFNPGNPNDTISPVGLSDIYVTKYDSSGNYQWTISVGGTGNDLGPAIVLDSVNNIYLAGRFSGTVDFDPGSSVANLTSAGGADIFIAKYNANGNYLWAVRIGGSAADLPSDIEVDHLGNILLTGSFRGTVDFDPGVNTSNLVSSGGADIFLAKYTGAGGFLWAKNLTAAPDANESAQSFAVDNNGNIYLVATFTDSIDTDPGVGTAMLYGRGNVDGFIAKYSAQGNYMWSKSVGGPLDDLITDLCLDKIGGLYTTGYFFDTLKFSNAPSAELIAMGQYSPFIIKYDTSGNYIWSRNFGNSGNLGSGQSGRAIAMGTNHSIYATGWFSGNTVFDSHNIIDTITSLNNSYDVYIVKYDSAGNFKWVHSLGGNQNERAGQIAFNKGNLYVAGSYQDTADFDPGAGVYNLISAGSSTSTNAFTVKLEVCDSVNTISTVNFCGNSFTFGNHTYTSSGTYTQTFSAIGLPCDSIVTLNLTLFQLNPIITIEVDTLSTTQNYDSYQWLLNGVAIPNATNAKYTIKANGDYKVVVGNNDGCTDTSDVYLVTSHGLDIEDANLLSSLISVYPNPTNGILNINSPTQINTVLTGIDGRVVMFNEHVKTLFIHHLSQGVYFLRINDNEGRLIKVVKVTKE